MGEGTGDGGAGVGGGVGGGAGECALDAHRWGLTGFEILRGLTGVGMYFTGQWWRKEEDGGWAKATMEAGGARFICAGSAAAVGRWGTAGESDLRTAGDSDFRGRLRNRNGGQTTQGDGRGQYSGRATAP